MFIGVKGRTVVAEGISQVVLEVLQGTLVGLGSLGPEACATGPLLVRAQAS